MRIFLLASFPSLSFEDEPPLPFEDFAQSCGEHLSNFDMQELDAICSTPPQGKTAFAKAWAEGWNQWNLFNIQERKQRLSQEKSDMVTIASDQLRKNLDDAWQAADPLSREKALLGSLWDWIDEKRRQTPLSQTDLLGYGLQLQLLERKSMWNESVGQTQFNIHTQKFLEPVLEELRKQELPV